MSSCAKFSYSLTDTTSVAVLTLDLSSVLKFSLGFEIGLFIVLMGLWVTVIPWDSSNLAIISDKNLDIG